MGNVWDSQQELLQAFVEFGNPLVVRFDLLGDLFHPREDRAREI